MKLIRHQSNTVKLSGSVITLGNFDGIHIGHQRLLQQLITVSKLLSVPSVVITFEPLPKEFFCLPVPRLMRFREKWAVLKNWAIDYVVCLRFSKKLAELTAPDFVKKILVDQLQVKIIIVGDDFRFGAKRAGHVDLLRQLGEQYQFQVMTIPAVTMMGERVSSTRVRHVLEAGNMQLAQQLLNRSYRLSGVVVHGDKRGRILGFPTANFNLHRKWVPLSGVFVVRVQGIRQESYQGVANVGVRPHFGPPTRVLLEVHLFDFSENIYGVHCEIEFLHKLRDEEKFDSIDSLCAQMKQDVLDAKNYFLYDKI